MNTKIVYVFFLILMAISLIAGIYTKQKIDFSGNNYNNINHHAKTNEVSKQILIENNSINGEQILNNKTPNNSQANYEDSIIIALLGTDERDDEVSRSDVIILVKYIPQQSKVILVSVPRDTKVNIEGKGINRINAAYAYGGSSLAVKTLENLFNIKVDYFMKINFNGFMKIVDEIGGVKVVSKKNFYKHWDDNQLYIKKGENVLNGEKLLEYIRFRKDDDGDFGRISRQQEVIISCFKSLLQPRNIQKIPKLITIISANVDTNINWVEIIKIAYKTKMSKDISFEAYTLKTTSKLESKRWYEIIDEEDLLRLTNLLK